MKTIVTTLRHLMNAANTLGNTQAKKDKKAGQAFFDKQAKLVTILNLIQSLEKDLTDHAEIGSHSLNTLFNEAKNQIKLALNDLKDVTYPNKKFEEALNTGITQKIDMAHLPLKNLKRNLELRKIAAKAIQDKALDTAEQMQAYNKLCEQDAAILDIMRKSAVHANHELDLANKRWANFLKQEHNVEDLPELKEPKKHEPRKNPMTTFFTPLLDATKDLFKSVTDSKFKNLKAPFMSFLGKIAKPILSFFTNLLKPLFGGSDSKAQEFADNAADFVVGLVDNVMTSSSKQKAQDKDLAGEPIVPAFKASKAAPKPAAPTPASSSTFDLEEMAKIATSFFSPKK